MTYRRMMVLVITLLLGGGIGSFKVMAQDGAQSNSSITVFLAGASSVASYTAERAPLTGWGQVLGRFFTDDVTVVNEARSGRSSKSFIEEGRLSRILNVIKPGDYLLVQFGHNDQKKDDPARYTEPWTTYKSYLKQYIDGAREKGAHPILVTPQHRRNFLPNGKIRLTHGDYPAAMKELGAEMGVPVIDLHDKSQILFERVGDSGTKSLFLWLEPGEHENYPDGIQDNTHFNDYGAEVIAKIITDSIKEIGGPLANYVHEYGDHLYWKEPIGIVLPENIVQNAVLRGNVPLDVAILDLDGKVIDGWNEMQISVGDEVIYSGSEAPNAGEFMLNTLALADGFHELAIAVHHHDYGRVVKRVPFVVRNWWQMIDELLPPTTGGWLWEHDAIERLRTEEKSDGWNYAGDRAELFFGDATRLVRDGAGEEFLIWSAPQLKEFEVTVFLQHRTPRDGGITLSVSEDGARWTILPLVGDDGETTMVDIKTIDESEEGWRSISLHGTLKADIQANWFRITFEDEMPAESAQLGKVTLRGLNAK